MTPYQSQVFALMLEGKNQLEITSIMLKGVKTNANVQKCIKGNQHFRTKKYYGGIIQKLPEICLRDETFRQLIEALDGYEGTHYMRTTTRCWFHSEDDFLDWKETELHTTYGIPIWLVDAIEKQIIKHHINQRFPKTLSAKNASIIQKKVGSISARAIIRMYDDFRQKITNIREQ